MHDVHAARGPASARRHRRFLPPIDARYRAAIAILIAAMPMIGCDGDASDETYETPNEVDGSQTEGTPAGDVDSTDGGG